MRLPPVPFTVDDSAASIEGLAAIPDLLPDGRFAERRAFLDTFDWRLYRAGMTLVRVTGARRKPRLEWRDGTGARLVLPGATEGAGFAEDLPAGPLHDRLAPVLEMRRLLTRVEVEARGDRFRFLDERQKTVARLTREELTAFPPGEENGIALPGRITALPVRGYPAALERLAGLAAALPVRPQTEGLLEAALAALGRAPGDYSSKIQLELSPEMTAGEALRRILESLFETLLANEEGTRRDLDSEFLHDFRVAVRRTRSALGQLRALLPPGALARFREEFRWLGSATGPTRDLDVYLLKLPGYRDALPPAVRDHLLPLRAFLATRHREVQAELAAVLSSDRYRRLVEGWRLLLAGHLEPAPPAASRPVTEVAGERIWRIARRLRRDGKRALRDDCPPAELHALRIDGKKLRYLLEFFRSLYPGDRVEPLVRTLKALQDNLGDFNDYSVQRRALGDFARRMAAAGATPAETFLAMGRLQAHFEAGQEEERRRFRECFESFSTPENRRELRELFRPEGSPA